MLAPRPGTLLGKLVVIDDPQVAAAIPSDVDADLVINGLAAKRPEVAALLGRYGMALPKGSTPLERAAARIGERGRARYIEHVQEDGVWRNCGDGYGLFDKTTGKFVAGPDGKPFVVTLGEASKVTTPAVETGPDAVVPTPAQPVIPSPAAPAASLA